ncbi:MAG: SDR family oxidoreductase [Candidatus Pacebacteria bacterium]|jgi:nucleoside-diphosphate-sugar epimerase|nr:SDR family oxidoreductase [Candidatus Paceibacterota bacterium]
MKKNTVLLTGVTGQVVSELAMVLQKHDYRILYLIRPSGDDDAQARLAKILPVVREGMDIAIEGDITLPIGGFSVEDVAKWYGKVDKILHAAAAISFEEKDADSVWKTNFVGTQNMLELADALGVTDFHYISTAYISGTSEIFRETDLDVGQEFFNPYERSKIAAEKLVHAWPSINFTISRLPIVLGSSTDGEVLTFHSYYGFFIPFWRMLKSWRRRWDADQGDCASKGVTFDEHGVMNIPLFIDCSETSVLNMVCVDWVALVLSQLLSLPSSDRTYHLVDQNPMRVKEVIEVSLAHMRIAGVMYGPADNSKLTPFLAKIQGGVTENIRIYQPYVKHGTIFKCDNLVNALGDNYPKHPKVDEKMLCMMLDYAMSVDFGKK